MVRFIIIIVMFFVVITTAGNQYPNRNSWKDLAQMVQVISAISIH